MNIISILNKLKAKNMISNTEEGIALFSDCFNKFGISLLLLKSEDKFDSILNFLIENKIPLQKSNGIYNLRIFAVEEQSLKRIVSNFSKINELNFLRNYPEMIAESKNIEIILENMKKCQQEQMVYKIDDQYDINKLLLSSEEFNDSIHAIEVNNFLKSILSDKSILEKIENNISSDEDISIALELQKVENKICEEYLFPADDGWKIVINNKEINTFQNIKDTISKIVELNIPITFRDAFIFVLFYKTSLNVLEIEQVLKENNMFKGEN